jgi:hypothetical protein
MRQDKVVRGQHLARDFRVASLVRLPKAVSAEMKEEQDKGERCHGGSAGKYS